MGFKVCLQCNLECEMHCFPMVCSFFSPAVLCALNSMKLFFCAAAPIHKLAIKIEFLPKIRTKKKKKNVPCAVCHVHLQLYRLPIAHSNIHISFRIWWMNWLKVLFPSYRFDYLSFAIGLLFNIWTHNVYSIHICIFFSRPRDKVVQLPKWCAWSNFVSHSISRGYAPAVYSPKKKTNEIQNKRNVYEGTIQGMKKKPSRWYECYEPLRDGRSWNLLCFPDQVRHCINVCLYDILKPTSISARVF